MKINLQKHKYTGLVIDGIERAASGGYKVAHPVNTVGDSRDFAAVARTSGTRDDEILLEREERGSVVRARKFRITLEGVARWVHRYLHEAGALHTRDTLQQLQQRIEQLELRIKALEGTGDQNGQT